MPGNPLLRHTVPTRGHAISQTEMHAHDPQGNQSNPEHYFWQASYSACTTVLTETLSKKKNPHFARFFCCDVHNKLENDLETNDK